MPLIDSKTLIASAEKPAGPVTLAWRPSWFPLIRSRTFSTGTLMVSDLPLPLMSAVRIAPVRSLEKIGGAKALVRLRCSAFSAVRSPAMRVRSAVVRPPSRR